MFDLRGRSSHAIQGLGMDGWLLYDFRGLKCSPVGILQMPHRHLLSRVVLLHTRDRASRKLQHRIEAPCHRHARGRAHPPPFREILRWQELAQGGGPDSSPDVNASPSEYVPRNAHPYVSRVRLPARLKLVCVVRRLGG